ncbi:MAG: nitroreductase family protein [Deltaproteobacteria bacterium]|nr:nitroreductase family protein [Deltaproteobacteria bacterium]
MIEDLIKKNRSCRRFHQECPINRETLNELVNLARISASAANIQPLRYILSCDPLINSEIFSCLGWAAYLKDWAGPVEGERPPAYIIMLGDTELTKDFWCDHGIASQSILLGAREKGLAGCMLGMVNKERLGKILTIEPKYRIMLVLAIGKPKEEAVIEQIETDGDIKYWRDENQIHHVPKRRLEDIIIRI